MRTNDRPLPSTWYTALIVGLGVHVLCQLLLPMSGRRFESRVWVRRVGSSDPSGSQHRWPVAGRSLARQGETDIRIVAPSARRSSSDNVREVVAVAATPHAAEQQSTRAAIEFARQCEQEWAATHLRERQTYDWRLQEARHYERKAWDAVERFLLSQFSEPAQVAHNPESGQSDTVVSSRRQEASNGLSARREALVEQIGTMQAELAEQRRSKTDAHPEIVQLTGRIAELERALVQLESDAGEDEPVAGRPIGIAPAVARSVSDLSASAQCELLIRDYREAVAERQRLERERTAATQRPAEVAAYVVGAATPAVPLPSSSHLARQLAIWLITLVVGGGAAMLTHSTRALRFVHGEWDASRSLGISILGELSSSTTRADRIEQLTTRRRWLHWAVQLAEYGLLLVAAGCAWAMWRGSRWETTFTADPWWTVSTMWRGLF